MQCTQCSHAQSLEFKKIVKSHSENKYSTNPNQDSEIMVSDTPGTKHGSSI